MHIYTIWTIWVEISARIFIGKVPTAHTVSRMIYVFSRREGFEYQKVSILTAIDSRATYIDGGAEK